MIDKLKDISNAAITLGITPMAWQNNFVKLIYKKNEATKIENYTNTDPLIRDGSLPSQGE